MVTAVGPVAQKAHYGSADTAWWWSLSFTSDMTPKVNQNQSTCGGLF